ncbi:MAG: peptidase M50, partial [Rhodobacteraceae bacterium]|nr:peptidase M50 [Paracoccaceae bacterium]
ALLAGPVLVLTLTASVAIRKPGDWSQDRIMLSTIVNLERLAAVNGPVPSFGSPGY